MCYVPGSLPPSRPPAPAPCRSGPPLPENTAASAFSDGTRILPSHAEVLARAFSEAAELNILIDYLSLPGAKAKFKDPEAISARLASVRDKGLFKAFRPRIETARRDKKLN